MRLLELVNVRPRLQQYRLSPRIHDEAFYVVLRSQMPFPEILAIDYIVH